MHEARIRATAKYACLSIFSAVVVTVVPAQPLVAAEDFRPGVYSIGPTADAQYLLQERLIQAVPGDVIQLEAGRYEFREQLDVVADNVTIRGRGADKTVLSFRNQTTGSLGIHATGNNFAVSGLAIEDTAGNAIKVLGARNVSFRDVRVEWTGEPTSSNGAYGIYPVQCQHVLIENCHAIGASDAGIYVGQCHHVVVRSSRAERNVAGIEIENTIDADVYDNVATNNTGGILVFDLPGLPVKAGRSVRVFRNQVVANNHVNFAAAGTMVANVAPGTGISIMATDQVEVFENEIRNNQTSNLMIISFLAMGKRLRDRDFDPVSEGVSIHNNEFSDGGANPSGTIGQLLLPVLGKPFPDILFDGFLPPAEDGDDDAQSGKSPTLMPHRIVDNGAATFVNFNLPMLSAANVLTGRHRLERDLAPYRAELEPLPEVSLASFDEPASASDAAVRVYRSAPEKLSGYGLFEGDGSSQQPVAGVVPYDMNTPLFSDYTSKYRFVRVPEGTEIEYRADGVFEFPVGTVIAKTFSYPHDMTDPSAGERLLETRIERLYDDDWYGFSYIWNDEQTEATLTLGGGQIDVSWTHSDGSQRTNHYRVPNALQCLHCHSRDKAYVPLGPTASNLNRHFDFASGSENQLAHLVRQGMLRGAPDLDSIESWPRYDHPQSGTVDERARAWLHVNCAHCHNPTGSARTSGLDLQISQSDPSRFGVWKTPVAAGHGSGGNDYDIVPGKPDESILVYRLESSDPSIKMPNIAGNLVPTEAAQLVRKWIEQMEPEKNDLSDKQSGG